MATAAELKAHADAFDWDTWNQKLLDAVGPSYRAIALQQAKKEAEQHGLDFDAKDPFVSDWFEEYLGEQVTGMVDTTRSLVADIIQRAFDAGDTGKLGESLASAFAFSPARANTIARTETAIAYGHGAGLLYRQNGIENVEISDGDDDEECAAADGQIWTVDEYLAEPIAHPNCVRSASPVLPEDDESDTQDDAPEGGEEEQADESD